MNCKNCGERLLGDGYSTVLECPNISEERYAQVVQSAEPDSGPWYCEPEDIFKTCDEDELTGTLHP